MKPYIFSHVTEELMLLLVLGIDQNIINKDNYEFVQIRQSSRCLLLEPSIGDNLTLGRSSSRYSTLEADPMTHHSGSDNTELPRVRKLGLIKPCRIALQLRRQPLFISEAPIIRCPCSTGAAPGPYPTVPANANSMQLLALHRPGLCDLPPMPAVVGFDCSREDHHTSFSFLPDVQHRHGSYPPSTHL
ncbi:hypothetical protein Tco_0748634 [Tanacetum coccineum]|uniref:Uncharacterized protein n=1 Tax=Tanacetum coccineum TaxID=301880 RepID=A0ABQ4YW90_9ASTR